MEPAKPNRSLTPVNQPPPQQEKKEYNDFIQERRSETLIDDVAAQTSQICDDFLPIINNENPIPSSEVIMQNLEAFNHSLNNLKQIGVLSYKELQNFSFKDIILRSSKILALNLC